MEHGLSKRRTILLICSIVLGLLIMFLFSGKSRVDLESIAVSTDEQYIACFETGRGHKIRCFHADGSLAFDFDIPADLGSGGYCSLWFDSNGLCVLFYRTNKIAHFSTDGTITSITENTSEMNPTQFPHFSQKDYRYVYEGNKIDVVYNRRSFMDYWFFGSERFLAVTPRNGEMKIVYSWNATSGPEEQITG